VAQPSLLPSAIRPGPGPAVGRWALGVGDTLARVVPGPAVVGDLLRLLNRLGGLAISDGGVEFDGEEVKWSDVDEIEAPKLIGYLLSGALDKQIDKLPVPWFPFRGLALDAASQAALTLFVVIAGDLLGDTMNVRIPAEVHHRGRLRHHLVLTPGVVATILLADPAVTRSLTETARSHGVPIRPAEHDPLTTAQRRAGQLTRLARRLVETIRR
jgi:hypothetical protein